MQNIQELVKMPHVQQWLVDFKNLIDRMPPELKKLSGPLPMSALEALVEIYMEKR